jgi:chromosome partitioning protein
MTKVISFVNAKGGVGKTTASVNVAAGLAYKGYRTLFIDLDPQGNATSYLALESLKNDVGDLLLETATFEQVLQSKYGLDIIPVIPERSQGLENRLTVQTNAEMCLVTAIEDHIDIYDYVVIDCPPALGKITGNALLVSDYYIVPVLPEPFSIEGIAALNSFTSKIYRVNDQLKFGGFLLNKYNPKKKNSTNHIIADHIKNLDLPYFTSSIREDKVLYDVVLAKSGPIFNQEAMDTMGIKDTNSLADFSELCEEIITKL